MLGKYARMVGRQGFEPVAAFVVAQSGCRSLVEILVLHPRGGNRCGTQGSDIAMNTKSVNLVINPAPLAC